MNNAERLDVLYRDKVVGVLFYDNGRLYFRYGDEWLENGFSVSPLKLPLKRELFCADGLKFDGLFGVFADSLPDGWGTRLAIRALAKRGIRYEDLSPLAKLSYVGPDGLGALTYRPSHIASRQDHEDDYEKIALAALEFEDTANPESIDTLFLKGGSSGGARPKAHLVLDGEEWIVKFRERNDPFDIGRMEYEYNLAARECGVEVPDFRLLPSSNCEGYFASKRFDRKNGKRIHVLSLAGLLENPRDIPNLDYVTYLQAAAFVTASQEEVMKAYRIAVFNVLAGNRDDHSKNFGFVYDEDRTAYVVSPAFDLTYVDPMREHEMSCCGNGNPGVEDLLALAKKAKLSARWAKTVVDKTEAVVRDRLAPWTCK